MFKKLNKKGFTLAELLVVVAIIGVLVAISIPIFTNQLEKSRDAVTMANIRAAYAEASIAYLTEEDDTANKVTVNKDTTTNKIKNVCVADIVVKGQKKNGAFTNTELPFKIGGGLADKLDEAPTDGKVTVYFTWDANNACTASDTAA